LLVGWFVREPKKEAADVLAAVEIPFELEKVKVKERSFAVIGYRAVGSDLVLPFDRHLAVAVGTHDINPPTVESALGVGPITPTSVETVAISSLNRRNTRVSLSLPRNSDGLAATAFAVSCHD